MHLFAYCLLLKFLHTSHSIDVNNGLIGSNDEKQDFYSLMKSFMPYEKQIGINNEAPFASAPRKSKEIDEEKVKLKNEKRTVKTVKFIHELIRKLTTVGKLKLGTLSLNLKNFFMKNNLKSSDPNTEENNVLNDQNTKLNKQDIDSNSAMEVNDQWDNNWDDWGGKKTNIEPERQENAKLDYFDDKKPNRKSNAQQKIEKDSWDDKDLKIEPKIRDYANWDFEKSSNRTSVLDLLQKPIRDEREEKKRNSQNQAREKSYWEKINEKLEPELQNKNNWGDKKDEYLNTEEKTPENNYRDEINGKLKQAVQNKDDWNEKDTNSNVNQNIDGLENSDLDDTLELKMHDSTNRLGRKLQNVEDEFDVQKTANMNERSKIHTNSIMDIEKYKDQFEEKMQELHLKSVKVFLGLTDHKSLALHVIDEYVDLLTDIREKILRVYTQHFTLGDDIMKKHWSYLRTSILSDSEEEKVRLLRYLCDRRVVCKPYPAFSDHLSDFVELIFYLPDQNLRLVLKTFSEQEKERDFIMNILFSDPHSLIQTVNSFLKDNITENKIKILRTVSLFLKNKFKIFSSENMDLNNKVKALKILMDIIDKAFEADSTEITFSDLRFGIEKWIDDTSYEKLQSAILTFLKHIVITIGDRINDVGDQEMKALTAFVVFDETSDRLYDLLEIGSRFVEPKKI